MSKVIYDGLKIKGTLPDGSGQNLLTHNSTTGEVGSITGTPLTGTLTDSYIFVGNASNVATGVPVSGDITLDNTGLSAIAAGVIVDADINASAAITLTKLAASTANRAAVFGSGGFLEAATATLAEVNFSSGLAGNIQAQLDLKQATITGAASTVTLSNLTPNRAVISNASGKIASATLTTDTEIGYLNGVTSSVQTQLNTKLSASLGTLVQGDVLYYDGANWTNLARGSSGQVLTSTGSSIQWQSGTSNGIPAGGTANQYLTKIDGTDYNTQWSSLTLSKITDVTALAADVNLLVGQQAAGLTGAEIGYLIGVTAPIQTQLASKLGNSLGYNNLFVGNSSGLPSELGPGDDGDVLTTVGTSVTWQPPTPVGDVSGPVSSTDNAIARFNGTSGDSIQNSGIIIDDTNNITGAASLTTVNQGGIALSELTSNGTDAVTLRAAASSAAYTITLPAVAPGSNTYLKYDGADYVWDTASGSGTVTSVSGTTNRISIGGTGTDPIVDIDAAYVGQASITTLGTITTGTWSADTITVAKGGTNLTTLGSANQFLVVNGAGTALEYGSILNGSGTTAGVRTFNLGGTLTQNTALNGAFQYYIGNTTPVSDYQVYATTVLTQSSGNATLQSTAAAVTVSASTDLNLVATTFKLNGSAASTPSTEFARGDGTWAIPAGSITSVSLATGTSGTDVNVSGSPLTGPGTITLNIPDASASNRGLITTGTQTVAGAKTFSSTLLAGSTTNGVSLLSTQGIARFYTASSSTDIGYATSNNFLYSTLRWQMPGITLTNEGNTPGTTSSVISGGGGVTTHSARFASNGNGTGFTFNVLAATAYGGGFTYNMVNISNSGKPFDLSTGAATYRSLSISPSINTTGGTTDLYGIDYNPTLTSVTGVTHYGILIRPTAARSGFGTATPTAKVHIAGSAAGAASTSSLKIDSGTLLVTPENGSIENDGTHLYVTLGGTRYQLDQQGGGGGVSDGDKGDITISGTGTVYTVDADIAKTWTGIQSWRDNSFRWYNPANTFYYNLRTGAIAANRNITLPLLTGDDTFTTNAATQTLTNKTLTSPVINTQITTASATITAFNTVATTLNMGGALTSFTLGGTPTTALSATLFGNATTTGVTKTVNIGTGGASGSTTNINLGSSTSGAVGTLAINNATVSLTGTPTTEASFGTANLLARSSAGQLTKIVASGGSSTVFLNGAGGWTTPSGGAGLVDGDYGDITVSGVGTVMTIDNDVVTFAKMQNISTGVLLGRTTASSGDIEELTVSNGLTLASGAVQLGGSLTGNTNISGGGSYNFTTTGLTSVQLSAIGSLSMTSAGANASIYVLGSTLQTFQIGGSSGAVLDLGSDATGDLYTRNSSGKFVRLPIGTYGQSLVTLSGTPTWTNTVIQSPETGTTRVIADSDNGTIIPFSNASPITVTIPAGLAAGTSCTILRLAGAGVITFSSGGTLESAGTTLSTEKTAATIYHRGSDIHTVLGAVGSASGIGNTAAANEMMKSDGADAVPSGVFSTTAGDLDMGSSSISGDRTIEVISSSSPANLNIIAKSTSGYVDMSVSGGASGSVRFTPASGLINVGVGLSRGTIAANDLGTTGGDLALDSGQGSSTNGNIQIFTRSASVAYESGRRIIYVLNRDAAPTGNPSGGLFMYSEGGELKVRTSSGRTKKVGGDLDSTSASTAGATITLDMNSQDQRIFVGSATFATGKTMALSNTTNSLVFSFIFEVTNVAATLGFPTDWLKNSTDFDGSTWTPPSTGKYELAGSWNGTNWYIKIDGPFI